MKGNAKILISLCAALLSGPLFSQNVLDGPYIKENNPKRRITPYTHLREADVMWSKRIWRIIDVREKINQPFYYPTQPGNSRKALIDVLHEALDAGNLTAYGNPLFDDEFKVPLTITEIHKIFEKIDTLQREKPDRPGEFEQVIVRTPLESDKFKQYRIKEDWFFDKQRSVMDVRIIGICPVIEDFTDAGESRGYKPLFWVYFPEARNLLARAEAFNRRNDGQTRTFDDVFWKRQFSSFIYKESNVFDRYIEEYKKGLDVQLESERIKGQMQNWEHDLWHF